MTLSSRLLRGAALKLFLEWILQDTWREHIVAKEQVKFETTHSSEASSGSSHHLLCKLHSTWPKEWRYICGNLLVRWNHGEVNMEAVKGARINDWTWLWLDWFKGKFTGNHRFSHSIILNMGLSCRFSLKPIHWDQKGDVSKPMKLPYLGE